jgi:hypothetical protein
LATRVLKRCGRTVPGNLSKISNFKSPMIHEFARPVPVKTPLGLGSVWYVESQGAYFNNIYAVILEDTGETRYMRSDQFVVLENPTMDIKNLGAGTA